jgi:hypothetical protein
MRYDRFNEVFLIMINDNRQSTTYSNLKAYMKRGFQIVYNNAKPLASGAGTMLNLYGLL